MKIEARLVANTIICLAVAGTKPALGFAPNPTISKPSQIGMGLIDDLQLIFSEEGKKNKKAYEQRERDEMIAAQNEIMERRNNPEKMEQYEREVQEKRVKLQKERDVWKFQQKTDGDPLDDWTRLRQEGKIKVGSDLERDEGSSRFGSEGLVEVRVDERMPYIDQGYVDDNADFMGNIMGMFGGKKKKGDEKEWWCASIFSDTKRSSRVLLVKLTDCDFF